MKTYVTFGYCGGGRLYEGPDREAAIEAAERWSSEEDAGARVRVVETGAIVLETFGAGG